MMVPGLSGTMKSRPDRKVRAAFSWACAPPRAGNKKAVAYATA